ncbi:InlB B-repeat-containing protein [uncultured Fibrobacter sp.]|uniref:InlB B-repeat-containing protein n=1 Tax=uncultured Fibrobacter sp. TaxID=261512 RepID=UPI0025E12ACF|nr:InlB B-repeat-containing protein [uncultured Fibrobacter sp.]
MMTIKEKILVFLLALAFNAFAAAWTGSTSEPENMKKIDGKAFYVITTADELAWFANQVNGGKTNINAVLENDIVFGKDKNTRSSVKWTPIGKDTGHQFAGILDGAGYTIYGIYVSDIPMAGIVGVLKAGGVVRNLKTNSGYVSGGYRVGGFVAHNDGIIQNVENNNEILRKSGDSTSVYVGGIAGHNNGTITTSSNKASVSNNAPTALSGGIAGKNSGKIENSGNSGSVAASCSRSGDGAYSGGIVGLNTGSINKIKNVGAISVDGTYTYISINASAGGNSNCTFESAELSVHYRCTAYNKAYGGGIVGSSTTVVSNSINSGKITNRNSIDRYINGIIASGKAKNSIDLKTLKYWLNETEIQGISENMQKDQFAWILNTTNGTETNSGIWTRSTGYPDFAKDSNLAIYRVVFNDDGATSNRYTNYKGLVTFPENPEPAEGFVFKGWYNSEDVKVKPTTVFTADQTVNAVYVEAGDVFWTINFFNTDAKSTLLETKLYQHGSIVSYGGEMPTRETTAQYIYTFKGWNVEPANAVDDFDYYAVYDSTIRSYVITFNNFDGSKIESGTFEYGKMPSCSKTPSRATTAEWKYTHKGWKPALDYVTEDASYTAIFDSSKVEYKVTFLNGTTVIDEQMVPYGSAAVAPTNVTREGYKFVGWNTTFSKIIENLTVKALFEELTTYIVKVVGLNGEKIDSVKVEENGSYVLPIAPKKDGYTFDAYYNGDEKIGVARTRISIESDITITAKYSKNPESSSSSVAKSSSSSVKSSSSNGGSRVVVEGELRQSVSPGEYIDPIIFKNVKTFKRNSSKMSFLQALPSQDDEMAIVGVVPEGYKAGTYVDSLTVNGTKYKIELTVITNVSSSSVKSSSSSAKTSITMQNSVPKFRVTVNSLSIQLSGAEIGKSYILLDMQGRVLQKGRVESANFNIAVLNAGHFFVKVGNQIKNVMVK